MHFFSPSPRSSSLPCAAALPVAASTDPAVADAARPEGCGWFDSSFELTHGVEITEHDDRTLYQLWSSCMH